MAQSAEELRRLRRRRPEELPPPPVLSAADKKLLAACARANLDDMKAALDAGASIDAYEPVTDDMRSGKKPMHIAAQSGFIAGVKLLRARGADIDEGDMRVGNPPLMLTLSNTRKDMFRTLLDMGADLWAENDGGHTAAEAVSRFDADIRTRHFGETIRHFEAMPEVEDMTGLTTAKLHEKNGDGLCLLDNPRMLRRIGEVHQALNQQGEAVDVALLDTVRSDGTTVWQGVCAAGALEAVVDILQEQGTALRHEALFEVDGTPSVLLQQATEWMQVPALFSYQNWKGATAEELEKTLKQLPEDVSEQVKNAYQLRTRLAADQAQTVGRGR